LEPENDSFPRSRRAAVFKTIDNFDAASSDLAHVEQTHSVEASALYNKAVAFSLNGQTAEAVDLLKKAIQKSSVARNYAKNDDLFEPLKLLPEFQQLMNASECGL
jgi:tetratricopeptide (TPR) repeat protein